MSWNHGSKTATALPDDTAPRQNDTGLRMLELRDTDVAVLSRECMEIGLWRPFSRLLRFYDKVI